MTAGVPLRAALAALAVVSAALALGAAPAWAGDWMQISCQNPDGSAAPSDGWVGFAGGGTGYGSNNNVQCSPGNPMLALISNLNPEPVGAIETLQYRPPAGSTLVGGTISVSLSADGGGTNASGVAALYAPAENYDGSDVFFQCASGLAPCSAGTNDYAGALSIPGNRGGTLSVAASCGGATGYACNSGGTGGAYAFARVNSAQLLLSSGGLPEGTDFSGSALQPGARGTAHLVMTASDVGGPGVYLISEAVDGRAVWSGTPNTNGGKCAAVGTDQASGALMFDWQQPCPAAEVDDLPVPTSGLPDGSHRLTVSVEDGAQNVSTVLDQEISTSNPQTTPAPPRRSVHARFAISWRWNGRSTVLRSIRTVKLPRDARVRVSCSGRGCPRLRVRTAPARSAKRLWRTLGGKRFRSGDHLLLTVTAPHRRALRIRLSIRDGLEPRARLVKR